MMTFFWKVVAWIGRALFSLRYRVSVKGLDALTPERLNRKGGVLFLPNHPAHMDPLILFLLLWPRFRMRPLVIEYVYRMKLLSCIMRLVKAMPVPNFDASINPLKIKQGEKVVQKVAQGLAEGKNFIFYPSGRLKLGGKELLGGASGAHSVLKQCPQANVVLIRTSGLWGSTFSRALEGTTPDLMKMLWKGLWILTKNLFFFTPRRRISIEIEVNPPLLPREEDRLTLNRYLEQWYNRYRDDQGKIYEEEPIQLTSYSFYKQQLPSVYHPPKRSDVSIPSGEISEEIRQAVYGQIRTILEDPGREVRPEMSLAFDLGLDSLNVAELIGFLASTYKTGQIYPENLETVQNVLEVAQGGRRSERPMHSLVQVSWPKEQSRPEPTLPLGKTSQEAFLVSCARMGGFAACGDDLVGVLSYRKLRLSVLLLARYFQTLPEERVAVLLPASCGAYIVILALQFAKKIPVMLNWTLGPYYLEQMMQQTEAKRVITSWRFLDRLSHVDFGSVIDQMELLEDIREKHLSLSSKLAALITSWLPLSKILSSYGLDSVSPDDTAVVLFTSGTEAVPKGVPLSHKNILSNQRTGLQCIQTLASDVVYGILPPFHSFGYSVAGFLAFFSGIKIAFYPDPTDSFALAEGVARWRVSLFCAAPNFLKGLLQAATPEQLKTIRLFITGAEKASKELMEKIQRLEGAPKLLEGYGITECAPILTITRANLPHKGVGQLLPDIELCTIHPETQELLPPGKEGEICVRGPNVFSGYLGNPRNPFIEKEGKQWYRTGDIGYLDPEGNLILSGRLKRFTKVGGEMISLGAIEEALIQELLQKGKIQADLPSLALCADERNPEKAHLVLFTTLPIDKEQANEILYHFGFSRLVKISSVRHIPEMPILGTGKTDYRKLQSWIYDATTETL